ncbi:hypothetical protein NDK43_05495 [Neobacillus pocheonensis]|uniref:Uncharacterized protein n=1 Tax=Neobacillus pocheonensis TaxID=363869 RepID=A0ABT0W6J0_9BACI|nr:hypothetical protein [Neobacillus pocheonensis]
MEPKFVYEYSGLKRLATTIKKYPEIRPATNRSLNTLCDIIRRNPEKNEQVVKLVEEFIKNDLEKSADSAL